MMRRLSLVYAISVQTTITLFSFILISCTTVGPNYHRSPQAVINQPMANGAFLSGKVSAFVNDPVPNEWWKLYQDPVLNNLIQQTLSANTDLRVATARLAKAQASLDYADSARRPTTKLEASPQWARYSAEELLIPTGGKALPNDYVYGIGAGISYQVDLFGQVSRSIESATADLGAARAAKDAVRITVVAETTRAYLEVCSSGHEIEVAKKSLALQAKSTALTQRLVQVGRGISLDTTRSSGQEDQIHAGLPLLVAAQRLALYRLAVLVGKPPAEFPIAIARCTHEPKLKAPIPIGDGMALLKRRPDIRRAEFELHTATANIGVVTADLYPKVTLGASLGSIGLDSHFLHDDTIKFSFGPLISWQFPDRTRTKVRIQSAKADQQIAFAQFDGVVLNALRETESALEVYARDLDRLALLEQANIKAKQAVKDSMILFKVGRQNYLPVLDAHRILLSTEQAIAVINGKIASDQVAVFLALGGGWE
jgi:multidrug efflux system outer membrane protein